MAGEEKIFCKILQHSTASQNSKGRMGTIQELEATLCKKDEEIRNLQKVLQQKDVTIQQREEEIQQLRSHLDKFQSVFPFGGIPAAFPSLRRSTIREPRKVRAQGISAEPQDLQTLTDLSHQKFNEYAKTDRLVVRIQSSSSQYFAAVFHIDS